METETIGVSSVQRIDSRHGHKHTLGVSDKLHVDGGDPEALCGADRYHDEQGKGQEESSVSVDPEAPFGHPMEGLAGANESSEPGNTQEGSSEGADDSEAPSLHESERQKRALDLGGNEEEGNGAIESYAAEDYEACRCLDGTASSFHVHWMRAISLEPAIESGNGDGIFMKLVKTLSRLQSFSHCSDANLPTENRSGDDINWSRKSKHRDMVIIGIAGPFAATLATMDMS